MPLLKPTDKTELKKVSLELSVPLLDEIKSYCDWAKIERIDEFLIQASKLVLKKDRDWQKANKKTQEAA